MNKSTPITKDQLAKVPFNKLPEEAKRVITHKLHDDLSITPYRIAKLLGLSESSVYRYVHEQTKPDKTSVWEQYGTSVSKLFKYKEDEIHASVLSHIETKIPKASMDEATRLLKTLGDGRREDRKVNITSDKTMVFQVIKGK